MINKLHLAMIDLYNGDANENRKTLASKKNL